MYSRLIPIAEVCHATLLLGVLLVGVFLWACWECLWMLMNGAVKVGGEP